MNKVVVLGDGILGSELVKQTNWDCLSRKKDNFDITNPNSFNKLIDWEEGDIGTPKYNVVVNCIACTDTYSKERQKHWDINYKAVADLVEFCNLWKIKLIHISTDHIYTNSKSRTSEEEIPVHMETWYGYTKLLGDAHVQLKSNNYLIFRESHKPYPFPYKVAWLDQITNGDYVNIIANIMVKMINNNLTGIFNIGTQEKNWYDYTKEEFNTVPGAKYYEAPRDITMNLEKLQNELKNINK